VLFQREHAPVFDVVIELQRDKPNEWTVYRPVAKIVDAIYAAKPHSIERRVRAPAGSGSKLFVWQEGQESVDFVEEGRAAEGIGGL
jgi:hypothetical protein